MTGTDAAVLAGPLILLSWTVRLALAALLAAVCLTDLRERRIPNRLVLAALALALLWHAGAPAGNGLFDLRQPGALGAGQALAGGAAAFGAFLLLHLLRMMGAGDVKLAGALGAVFGLAAVPALLLAVFAFGGLLVLARLGNSGRRRALVANLRLILFARLAGSGGAGPVFDARTDTADRLPYALALAGGALVLAGLQMAGMA